VHPVQIAHWRKAALEQLQELFVDGRTRKARDGEFDTDALYEQIGRLKMELEWVKKKLACSDEDRRSWVEPEHPAISIRRRCALLGLSRASLYYEPVEESQENLLLMRLIDQQYTRVPFYGSRRMMAWLQYQGVCGKPQAGGAADGHRGGVRETETEPASGRAQDLSLPAEEAEDRASQPALVH
jgi:putative transposase